MSLGHILGATSNHSSLTTRYTIPPTGTEVFLTTDFPTPPFHSMSREGHLETQPIQLSSMGTDMDTGQMLEDGFH